MDIEFVNPGVDYMIQRMMDFQTEAESAFWSEPLYRFYPQLDKAYAISLPFSERNEYIERTMRAVYAELEDTINEKAALYIRHWNACKPQITAALSDAFDVDCANLFNDIRCNLSLNPIEPRFLKERCYDTFYLNSERGAIGGGIHEIIHFVWFHVWNRLFGDSYDEYERPSLKWILSEMVVESVMKDSVPSIPTSPERTAAASTPISSIWWWMANRFWTRWMPCTRVSVSRILCGIVMLIAKNMKQLSESIFKIRRAVSLPDNRNRKRPIQVRFFVNFH